MMHFMSRDTRKRHDVTIRKVQFKLCTLLAFQLVLLLEPFPVFIPACDAHAECIQGVFCIQSNHYSGLTMIYE